MSMVICTLGMHRSGTSMVSRVLNLMGASLGTDRSVFETGADNPAGYWEHARFRQINDALLDRFGGQWHRPPAFPADWLRDPVVQDLAREARTMVRDEFGHQSAWTWKDPRTCLTLPFWQEVVGPMRYVVCLRDPLDVAASLQRRNGLAIEDAELLWLAYMERALRHTAGQSRLFIDFDAVLADPAGQARRVALCLGLPLTPEDEARIGRAIEAFITPALRHHDRTSREPRQGTPVSFAATSLYLALREAGDAGGQLPDGELAAYAAAARAAASVHASTAAEATVLRSRNTVLQRETAGLHERVQHLEARCDAYERENQVVRRTIADIHASSAWRLVTAWRRLSASVLPSGSRRQAAVAGLVGRLARAPHPSSLPATGTPDNSQ